MIIYNKIRCVVNVVCLVKNLCRVVNVVCLVQNLGEWMDGWKDGWMDGWKDGWKDGWMEGKAGLRIAYSNQKRKPGFCTFLDFRQIPALSRKPSLLHAKCKNNLGARYIGCQIPCLNLVPKLYICEMHFNHRCLWKYLLWILTSLISFSFLLPSFEKEPK